MKKKYTVVIPIHEYNETVGTWLKRALGSVNKKQAQIILIVKSGLETEVQAEKGVKVITNTGNTDIASQLNEAVKAVETTYFTYLELDDALQPYYFDLCEEYTAAYEDVSIFLPIHLDMDEKAEKVLRFMNDAAWSRSLDLDEPGILTENSLKEFYMFSISGACIKVADFLEVGGLKPELEVSFTYEYLLRSLHQAKEVYVMNRIGYLHTNTREGSYSQHTADTMDEKTMLEWYEKARQEYIV